MRYNFEFNDGEDKYSPECNGNCTSVLVWGDHAWFMARLVNGWWRPAHFHNGRVTWLSGPVRSGHRCYNIALDHKRTLWLAAYRQECEAS
jgi:hypothetical protein